MRHVMDPIPEDMKAAERERNARYIDLTYECPVCGLEWSQPEPEPPFRVSCPNCEENDDRSAE